MLHWQQHHESREHRSFSTSFFAVCHLVNMLCVQLLQVGGVVPCTRVWLCSAVQHRRWPAGA